MRGLQSAGTGGGAAGGATIETTTPLVDEADVERGLGRTAAVDVTEEHVPAKQRSGCDESPSACCAL